MAANLFARPKEVGARLLDRATLAPMRTVRAVFPVLLVGLLAFLVRSLGAEVTFPGDGVVHLAVDDAQYHARRALFSFANFPSVLLFDSYLNFPAGAQVPWPPLYDWLLAAVARLFGHEVWVLERTLAWAPAALGALTATLVYAAGRQVAGRGPAICAALIFALLPASTRYSTVGNPDHHVAVACVATAALALYLAVLRADRGPSRRVMLHAGLVAARLAMLGTWHGSILYLALGEGLLLVTSALTGRRDLLVAQAIGAAVTAALSLPLVAMMGSQQGGLFSPIELSALQPTSLAAVAAAALGCAVLERQFPTARTAVRAARLATIGLGLLALFWLLPGVREGLELAFRYAGKTEVWIERNYEAQSLYGAGSAIPLSLYGLLGFAIPLAPLGALVWARAADVRAPAYFLAGWIAFLAYFAVDNARYGNDFAPGGAIGFALCLFAISRFAADKLSRAPETRARQRATIAALLAVPVMLAQPLADYAALVPRTLAFARGILPERTEPRVYNRDESLHHFARLVRAATPETSGYLADSGAGAAPEYGILCFPTMGFILKYTARRATPADNFGPYLGPPGMAVTRRFYALESEADAVELADRMRLRYVVTTYGADPTPRMMLARLHSADGNAQDGDDAATSVPRLEHFRLVTEGPRRGVSLATPIPGSARVVDVPYKLFERVKGAVLRLHGAPEALVVAVVEVATPTGRRFRYQARTRTNAAGDARLVVPYATETTTPARPTGPYRVRIGHQALEVQVSESAVMQGSEVRPGQP